MKSIHKRGQWRRATAAGGPCQNSSIASLQEAAAYVFARSTPESEGARPRARCRRYRHGQFPDTPTPDHIVQEADRGGFAESRSHGYSTFAPAFPACAAYAAHYARRFGVELDPEREGHRDARPKEGLANLAQADHRDGRHILAPNPCYPITP